MPFVDRITGNNRLSCRAHRTARRVPLTRRAALLVVASATAAPVGIRPVAIVRLPHGEREQWPVPDAVLRSGSLSFTGHTTVGDFVGTTAAVAGSATGSADVANTRGWVEASVATLVTGNAIRDRDLRATMEVRKYPTMRFALAGVTVGSNAAPPDTARVMLHGALTIHGVTREVSIPAALAMVGDTIIVSGGLPLDVTAYRIGGLTRFLGALRMQKDIEVRFHLRFEAIPPTANGALGP